MAANLGRGKSKRTWPLAELPLSVVFHLWLEAAALQPYERLPWLASKRRLSSLRGFLRRTLRTLGWLGATRRTARYDGGGGGAVQSVRPSKLPPIFKRRSEGKGERNGGAPPAVTAAAR